MRSLTHESLVRRIFIIFKFSLKFSFVRTFPNTSYKQLGWPQVRKWLTALDSFHDRSLDIFSFLQDNPLARQMSYLAAVSVLKFMCIVNISIGNSYFLPFSYDNQTLKIVIQDMEMTAKELRWKVLQVKEDWVLFAVSFRRTNRSYKIVKFKLSAQNSSKIQHKKNVQKNCLQPLHYLRLSKLHLFFLDSLVDA